MGTAHQSARACGIVPQADEVGSLSKIRRVLPRGRGYVTQLANMRVTAKQKSCDRGESGK